MTKLWIDDRFEAVTLVLVPKQELVRMKTVERDGYHAAVLGSDKKVLVKDKGQKIHY